MVCVHSVDMLITKKGIQVTKDKYIIIEFEAMIKGREALRDRSIKTNYEEAIAYDTGYINGLRYALNIVKYCKLPYEDENAETLEDKLRDEHRPIPEEREDASLFETMAEKFKPRKDNDGKR